MGLSAFGDTMVAFLCGSEGTVALGGTMVAFLLGFGDITAVSPLDLGTLRLGTPWWPSFMGLECTVALGDTVVAFLYGSGCIWGHHGGLPLWV